MTDPLYEQPRSEYETDLQTNESKIAAGLAVYDNLMCFQVKRDPIVPLGGSDVLIKKFNSTRDLVWANRLGGTGDDEAAAIATDRVGNIFVGANLRGPTTMSSKYLTNAEDRFHTIKVIGSQKSERVRRMVVVKYDYAGKALWATEVGACRDSNCYMNTVHLTPEGFIVVTGSFVGAITFGLMCGSDHCKTSTFGESFGLRQSHISCMQQRMESFNETCETRIPAAMMTSGTVCTEKNTRTDQCYVDTWTTMLDQNGTMIWAKNFVKNHTWMRATNLQKQLAQRFIAPLEHSVLLAYRGIAEKLSASTTPLSTVTLLADRSLNVKPLYLGLQDAYHMELQMNKTRLSPAVIQECVDAVHFAFGRIKGAFASNPLEFYRALLGRAAYIVKIPDSMVDHPDITPPVKVLRIENAGGYQSRLYKTFSLDVDFAKFNRESILPSIDAMNMAIDGLEADIASNDLGRVVHAISQPGLYFVNIYTHLLVFYAQRIAEMRKAWGKQLYHRELQMVFMSGGTVIDGYPSQPTSSDMQRGGSTLVLKILGDEFKPLTTEIKNTLIDNLVATNVFERGFETRIKPWLRTPAGLTQITGSDVDRDTVSFTFPLLGSANYSIPEPETVVISIPAEVTKFGSSFPFVSEFVVRRAPVGPVWNTMETLGDMYSRPILHDFRYTNMTMDMYIAGDRLAEDFTDEMKFSILDNMVVSGYDSGDSEYKFNKFTKKALREHPERITSQEDRTMLRIELMAELRYDLKTAETITVTIPSSVTEMGLSHKIGSFSVRPMITGSLISSMSAFNLGSGGSWHLNFDISGDRFAKPVTSECIRDFVHAIDSPNRPFTPNGWMLKAVPWMKANLDKMPQQFVINTLQTQLRFYIIQSASLGYAPQQREALSFTIPASCTLAGNRHYFAPFYINPGDEVSDPYIGESEPRYLQENQIEY